MMKRTSIEKRAKARAGLRVLGYVAAIGVVTCSIGFHQARAEMKDHSLDIGRSMQPLKDLLREPHKVNLSGETAWMSTGMVHQSVKEVLDRFETHCHENGVTGEWNKSPEIPADKIDIGKLDLSVMRDDKGTNEGSVVCFVKGENTPDGLLSKVNSFVKTRDLESLGHLRYAYASSDASGTYVMAMWTDGPFKMDRLVPKPGYEPGSDDPNLPRPANSLRMGSADIEGTTYGTHTYVSTDSPLDVTKTYEKDMIARGFLGIRPPVDQPDGPGELRVFRKDTVIVSYKAAPSKNVKGKTIVAVAEMGGVEAADVIVDAVHTDRIPTH